MYLLASIEEQVLDGDENTASMARCDFRLNYWHRHGEEPNSESLNASSGHENGKVGCKGLHDGRNETEKGAEAHGGTTSHHIADDRGQKCTNECGDIEASHGYT